jgi:hypothetical protein
MEIILDIGAVVIFLLVVASVPSAVRAAAKEVSGALAAFVAVFVVLFGLVFMASASQLATSSFSTQAILLVFLVVVAVLARTAWASKQAV